MAGGDYSALTPVVPGAVPSQWGLDVRDSVVLRFASAAARDAALTGLGATHNGMVAYLKDVHQLTVYNGAYWISLHPASAVVATSQSTSSNSFTDLATSGPAVTLQTGTSALVTLTVTPACSSGDGVYMGVQISGASTIAADTTKALAWVGSVTPTYSATFMITGLTTGSNVFTAKYRIAYSGTATFYNRGITVQALP